MLPVWLFQYFPSLDGPEHLHSAYVVKNSYNPENQTIRKNYRLNIRPFPNWGSQAPLLAEKMVFTLIIGLFIISVLYLITISQLRTQHIGVGILRFLSQLSALHGILRFLDECTLLFPRTGIWSETSEPAVFEQNNNIISSVLHYLFLSYFFFCFVDIVLDFYQYHTLSNSRSLLSDSL